MTKIAKNQKKPPSDTEANDVPGEDSPAAPETASLFKARPRGADDFDPLDLANRPEDYDQEGLHPSALADQGDEDTINPCQWFHPDGLTPGDVGRQDRALEIVEMGKPRTVCLSAGPVTYMRLTDPITQVGIKEGAGRDTEKQERLRLRLEVDTPVKLIGPATEHAVDDYRTRQSSRRGPRLAAAALSMRPCIWRAG